MFLEYHKLLRTVILCVIAEALNFIMPAIFYHTLKIPLFFEATEKGLKFLRPEKKSQIFEKKIS